MCEEYTYTPNENTCYLSKALWRAINHGKRVEVISWVGEDRRKHYDVAPVSLVQTEGEA